MILWLDAHYSWFILVFQDQIVSSPEKHKNTFCFVQVGPWCNRRFLHDKWRHPWSQAANLCGATAHILLIKFSTNGFYNVVALVGRGMRIIDGLLTAAPGLPTLVQRFRRGRAIGVADAHGL